MNCVEQGPGLNIHVPEYASYPGSMNLKFVKKYV